MLKAFIKKNGLGLILPVAVFFILVIIILAIYRLSINNYHTLIKEQVNDTGRLLSKEFNNIVKADISKLEDLKYRLEFTNGSFYKNWENDADLILKQNPSFKFIEWIDSSMIIKKIAPLEGNEQALNLDISKLDYRKDEWLEHSKSGKTNITSWLKLTQKGQSFLVDVPVYFQDRFQGTISAGMDFSLNFDKLIDYLDDQYAIEIYDDQGNLFYEDNTAIKLNLDQAFVYSNTITIDDFDNQLWHIIISPSKKLLLADGKYVINIALSVGLLLSFMIAFLIYFYSKAKQVALLALQSNLALKTANKKLEKARKKAEEASQAKTNFLSNMSHEIRTPLHALVGFIELIKNSRLSKSNREYVDLMDKSSNNLLNLVNDILEVDKIESGNTELNEIVFNPLEEIKELVSINQFLFVKKNIGLKTNFQNALGVNALGDKFKFAQAINNVLLNALKFTQKGEVVIIYSETIVENSLKTTVSIKDTGIGIPKKNLNSIFNRFSQIDSGIKKQHQGIGLGLAISKKLTNMMGGNITVESTSNKGSTFKISVAFKVSEKATINETKKTINLSNLNVLIVDDNNINVIVLKKLLEDFSIKADTAKDGKFALEKVKQKNYDLIFMDIHMPEMDGYTATKLIRETDKDVLILGLSANVTTESMKKAIKNGMNSYLTKPIKKEHLNRTLLFHFKQ